MFGQYNPMLLGFFKSDKNNAFFESPSNIITIHCDILTLLYLGNNSTFISSSTEVKLSMKTSFIVQQLMTSNRLSFLQQKIARKMKGKFNFYTVERLLFSYIVVEN